MGESVLGADACAHSVHQPGGSGLGPRRWAAGDSEEDSRTRGYHSLHGTPRRQNGHRHFGICGYQRSRKGKSRKSTAEGLRRRRNGEGRTDRDSRRSTRGRGSSFTRGRLPAGVRGRVTRSVVRRLAGSRLALGKMRAVLSARKSQSLCEPADRGRIYALNGSRPAYITEGSPTY
jgi:hypothetical protein